jgi:hypothetical protein
MEDWIDVNAALDNAGKGVNEVRWQIGVDGCHQLVVIVRVRLMRMRFIVGFETLVVCFLNLWFGLRGRVVDVEKCVAFERTGEGKRVAMLGGYFEGCVCASIKSATYGSGWEIGDCRCVDRQRMLGGR